MKARRGIVDPVKVKEQSADRVRGATAIVHQLVSVVVQRIAGILHERVQQVEQWLRRELMALDGGRQR